MCDAETIEEPNEDGVAQKDFACPYCQKKLSDLGVMINQMEEH